MIAKAKMGSVCAKNDAGKVASDAPRPIISRERSLYSHQGKAWPAAPLKQRANAECAATLRRMEFVDAGINFKIDKGVDKKADQLAADTANDWCAKNPDWEYTGVWNNIYKEGVSGEVSQFQVQCKLPLSNESRATASTTAIAVGDSERDIFGSKRGIDNLKKSVVAVDPRQSFVSQVSEGLFQKVSSNRFEIPAEADMSHI